MNVLVDHLDDELRVSPAPMIATLAAVGQLALLLAVGRADSGPHLEMQLFGLLCLSLAPVNWALNSWNDRIGRWAISLTMVGLILLADRWFRAPGLLSVLSIPTVLLATTVGMPAAIALACAETAGLALLAPAVGWPSVWVALAAIWGMLGLMLAVYRPIDERARYLEIVGEQARRELDEARDRKQELEQMRTDWLNACRQIRLANERLVSLRRIAEEAKRSKASFAANVSHEFRTPLNIITGLVSVLVEVPEVYGGSLSSKAFQYLQVVYRNCQHLSSMVDDVLDLSQVEAGRMALRLEWTDLADTVRSASETIRPLVEQKGLVFQVTVPDEPLRAHCDATRVRQVVLNLLSNAARLTEQGSITVRMAQDDQHALISVTDTGPGISPQHAEKIFEPFSKASTQLWHDKAGSGLGLSISKAFVELHGGRMWLESDLDVGTTFFVRLPLSGQPERPAQASRWVREEWVWHEPSFRTEGTGLADQPLKPRVVVYDQTRDLYPALARYSDELQYVHVESVPQALRELHECPARALIVNAADPAGLLSIVDSARGEVTDTPILGYCCPPMAEYALMAGAAGYLTKPISRHELAAAIEAVGRLVERVLIVDDELEVRELLTLFLRAYDAKIEVIAVGNGAQALVEMREAPPDLVLLDVLMPEMDGWEVLAARNADTRIRNIPILMISGQDPRDGPLKSRLLVATIGEGISLGKLLECTHELSTRLLQPG